MPRGKCKGNIVKIDSSITKTIATPDGGGKLVRNTSTKPSSQTEAGKADSVQLTSSSQLQAMGSSINDGAPVDSAKVEAIKQAIAEGRFKINPEMIADRLLNSVRETFAGQKG